jgi:hypothetical protein
MRLATGGWEPAPQGLRSTHECYGDDRLYR